MFHIKHVACICLELDFCSFGRGWSLLTSSASSGQLMDTLSSPNPGIVIQERSPLSAFVFGRTVSFCLLLYPRVTQEKLREAMWYALIMESSQGRRASYVPVFGRWCMYTISLSSPKFHLRSVWLPLFYRWRNIFHFEMRCQEGVSSFLTYRKITNEMSQLKRYLPKEKSKPIFHY